MSAAARNTHKNFDSVKELVDLLETIFKLTKPIDNRQRIPVQAIQEQR